MAAVTELIVKNVKLAGDQFSQLLGFLSWKFSFFFSNIGHYETEIYDLNSN